MRTLRLCSLRMDGSVAFLRSHLDHTQVMTVDLKTLRTRVLQSEPSGDVSALGPFGGKPEGVGC
jgi:hypothetical protein